MIWDGSEDPDKSGAQLCLGTSNIPSFRNMNNSVLDATKHSTDTTPFECSLPPLPAVTF